MIGIIKSCEFEIRPDPSGLICILFKDAILDSGERLPLWGVIISHEIAQRIALFVRIHDGEGIFTVPFMVGPVDYRICMKEHVWRALAGAIQLIPAA